MRGKVMLDKDGHIKSDLGVKLHHLEFFFKFTFEVTQAPRFIILGTFL